MKTVIFTGGGTLGHLYPALAVIEKLKEVEPATRVVYLSTEKEEELLKVHPAIDEVYVMRLQGWRRKLSFDNILGFFKLLKAVKRARKILKSERANLVVGMGGYLSGAVIFAAHKERIPALIHEQNACLGMANRFSMRYVKRCMMSFPLLENNKKVIFTGHPRMDQVKSEKYNPCPAGNKILITSGSNGAKRVNEVACQYLEDPRSHKYNITLVTGKKYYAETVNKLTSEVGSHYQVVPFIKDLPRAMSEVDAVISRAGATTIFEILGLGTPGIFLPSPNVVMNHQEKNASFIEKYRLGEVIKESAFSKDTLASAVDKVLKDKSYRKNLEENIRNYIQKNAQEEILKEIKKWW